MSYKVLHYKKSFQKKLVWDHWNKDHIKKHSVSIREVEEVYNNHIIQVESYKNRLLILGKTKQDRLLTVVCSHELQDDLYVVSARDMSKKERRIYYEQAKTDEAI